MEKFNAVYYEKCGTAKDVLKIGSFDIQEPTNNEVQVEIKMSGINPADVKIRGGSRGELKITPFIPHSDGAGIVRKIGKSVTNFNIGDRVWIYNGAWNRGHGTASTRCNLPQDFLIHLPDNTSFEVGACLGIPAFTAASCLLSLHCRPNDTILISGGAGSVGLLAIQLAKFCGLQVIATVSSSQKAKLAIAAGADYVIDYTKENVLEKILTYTNNELLDGLIDVDFGSNLTYSVAALKNNKTIAAYASHKTPNPVLPFYSLMFKQISLKPIFVYILDKELREQSKELIQKALSEKVLQPLIHKIYPFEEIIKAHEAVESQQKVGQILLEPV